MLISVLERSSTLLFIVKFMNNLAKLQVLHFSGSFFVSFAIVPNFTCIWRSERNVEIHLTKNNTRLKTISIKRFFDTKFCYETCV